MVADAIIVVQEHVGDIMTAVVIASAVSLIDADQTAPWVAPLRDATAGFARMIDELVLHDGDVHEYFQGMEMLLLVPLQVLAKGIPTRGAREQTMPRA